MINWWAITIICMWLSGALACKYTKDSSPIFFALVSSLCFGLLYIIANSL